MTVLRPLLACLAALSLLATPAACAMGDSATIVASGRIVTEARPVRGYTGVGLGVPGTLVVRQGPAESVSIEADDNLLPEIETVVENGSLRIRYKRKLSVSGRPTIRILVAGPTLDSLAVSGAGEILAEALTARSLAVSVAGSGDVKIARLEADTLKAAIAGSGDVRVAGRAGEVAFKIAGSGDIVADRLEARRATVSIAGSGDAALWARETLEVSISGSGDVGYYGDPTVTKKVAGSGSVRRLGSAP